MDVVGLGNRDDVVLSQRGQSTVEYVLLLAVVVAILAAIVNSAAFRDRFGEGGRFAKAIKGELQWNYRFGSQGREPGTVRIPYPGGTHPSYYNGTRNTSHFFGPKEPYPSR